MADATTKNKHTLHKKSNVIKEDGTPKLPSPDIIDYGELAINYAEGVEVLSIKNSKDTIVPFIPKKAFTEAPIITPTEGEEVYLLAVRINDSGEGEIVRILLDTTSYLKVYPEDVQYITTTPTTYTVESNTDWSIE